MDKLEFDELISMVEDKQFADSDLRWQACMKLGKMSNSEHTSRIIEVLVNQLYPPNCVIMRAHAAKSLGQLGAKSALLNVLDTLKDKHHVPRAWAAEALVQLGDEAAVSPLIDTALNDPVRGVRASATNALKRLCENKISPVCLRANEVVRTADEREKKRVDIEPDSVRGKDSFGEFKLGMKPPST